MNINIHKCPYIPVYRICVPQARSHTAKNVFPHIVQYIFVYFTRILQSRREKEIGSQCCCSAYTLFFFLLFNIFCGQFHTHIFHPAPITDLSHFTIQFTTIFCFVGIVYFNSIHTKYKLARTWKQCACRTLEGRKCTAKRNRQK